MLNRMVILTLAGALAFVFGCRTGDYKYDRDIYAKMPDLLKNDPELGPRLAYNEDGSVKVTFEKGEMFITLADGLDEDTRMRAASRAFEIFHEQYMNHPDIRREDGTFKREKIMFHGFVGDVELYVLEWKLGAERPTVISNRYGNFI